jgi:hypothetical protein
MKKMLLLFSHQLTDAQKQDAKTHLHVKEFLTLPNELQTVWSNIPPDIESLGTLLTPIKDFIQQNIQKGDIALIQGDFGATYIMVSFAKNLGVTPVYATTKRKVSETIESGKTVKKSIFEHRRFREYA